MHPPLIHARSFFVRTNSKFPFVKKLSCRQQNVSKTHKSYCSSRTGYCIGPGPQTRASPSGPLQHTRISERSVERLHRTRRFKGLSLWERVKNSNFPPNPWFLGFGSRLPPKSMSTCGGMKIPQAIWIWIFFLEVVMVVSKFAFVIAYAHLHPGERDRRAKKVIVKRFDYGPPFD